MIEAISVLEPLLTFLSLELVAAGYLINEVAENPSESHAVQVFSIFYGLSVIFSIVYLMFVAAPNRNSSGWLLVVAGGCALISVGAYGAGLYYLLD